VWELIVDRGGLEAGQARWTRLVDAGGDGLAQVPGEGRSSLLTSIALTGLSKQGQAARASCFWRAGWLGRGTPASAEVPGELPAGVEEEVGLGGEEQGVKPPRRALPLIFQGCVGLGHPTFSELRERFGAASCQGRDHSWVLVLDSLFNKTAA
jgi:hypothetical protein